MNQSSRLKLFGNQVVVPTNYSLYHAPVEDPNAKMEVLVFLTIAYPHNPLYYQLQCSFKNTNSKMEVPVLFPVASSPFYRILSSF